MYFAAASSSAEALPRPFISSLANACMCLRTDGSVTVVLLVFAGWA
jgi:hypothetical protein